MLKQPYIYIISVSQRGLFFNDYISLFVKNNVNKVVTGLNNMVHMCCQGLFATHVHG